MKTIDPKQLNKKRGLVLVAVLWVVMVLAIIITTIGQTSRLDTRTGLAYADKIRGKWAGHAGINTAIAVLDEDTRDSDSLYDIWSENIEDFNDIELDRCSFTVEVIDEASKLNINIATKEQLMQLPDITEDVADSILDWRDEDDDISENGAESGYYLNLEYPYPARNGEFKTIRELMLVRGVSSELLYEGTQLNAAYGYYNEGWINYLTCYSYDKNVDAEENQRVNINKADENQLVQSLSISQANARWIVQNRNNEYKSIADLISSSSPEKPDNSPENNDQPKAIDLETFYSIADKITVTDETEIKGRVNINTACELVLIALLEGNQQAAQDIMTYREGLSEGFTSLGELKEIKSIDLELTKKIIDKLTVRSNVFTIQSTGKAETTSACFTIEAVADRGKTPAEIIYYRQGGAI